MKFTINPSTLSQRINTLSRVINPKNALPILESVRLQLSDNQLKLTASDSEITLTTTIPVSDIQGEGSVCLDAKSITNAFKELKIDNVIFTVDEKYLTVIDYGTGKFKFVGQSADEYPITPSVNNDNHETINTLTLPIKDFAKNLNLCYGCTADDELRPQMCGVYFDAAPDDHNPEKKFTMVASDGHKLMRIIYKDIPANAGSFILSKKAATILKSVLPATEENINITVTERTAQIETEDYTLDCRLIEGRFPNYNSVIPQNNPFTMTVNSQNLLGAIRRVLVFGSATSSLTRFDIAEAGLKVSAQDIDYNTSAEEKINCEYTGSDIAIGFNGNFLYSLISGLNANEVKFDIESESRAAIVSPATDDEEGETYSYTGLLMPMMLE